MAERKARDGLGRWRAMGGGAWASDRLVMGGLDGENGRIEMVVRVWKQGGCIRVDADGWRFSGGMWRKRCIFAN